MLQFVSPAFAQSGSVPLTPMHFPLEKEAAFRDCVQRARCPRASQQPACRICGGHSAQSEKIKQLMAEGKRPRRHRRDVHSLTSAVRTF